MTIDRQATPAPLFLGRIPRKFFNYTGLYALVPIETPRNVVQSALKIFLVADAATTAPL